MALENPPYKKLLSEVKQLREEVQLLKNAENMQPVSIDSINLTDIIDIQELKKLLDHFYEVAGLGIGIIDKDQKNIISTQGQEICEKFLKQHPEICKQCNQRRKYNTKNAHVNEVSEFRCITGLWDVYYPIVMQNITLGAVYLGPFFYEDDPMSEQLFVQQAKKYGFEQSEYLKTMNSVPKVSREKLKALIHFYVQLAKNIIENGYKKHLLIKEQAFERKTAYKKLQNQNTELQQKEVELKEYNEELQASNEELRKLNEELKANNEKLKYFNSRIKQSEERFSTIIEHAGDAVYVSNMNGNIVLSNKQASNTLGYTQEELLSKTIMELDYSYPTIQQCQKIWSKMEIGDSYQYEGHHIKKNGAVFPVEISTSAIEMDGEKHIIGFVRDITKRKQAEQERNESEERFKSIFDNSIAGIAFTDAEGTILTANKALLQLIGYSIDEIVGLHLCEITFDEDCEKEKELLKQSIENHEDFIRYEKKFIHKDKHLIWVDISISLVRDDNGDIAYFVAVANDISQKKEHYKQLTKALEYNEMITQTSPVGIVRVDNDGHIVYANKIAEEILGLTKEKITQRNYDSQEWEITDFDGNAFPIEDLPFIRVKQTKQTIFNIQHAIQWPNKRRVFLSVNASPQLNEQNEFFGMIATIEDITEKIKAEQERKENYAFREQIIKNAAEGLCVFQTTETYSFIQFSEWNQQMKKISGYSIDEINKFGWYHLFNQENTITHTHALERLSKRRLKNEIISEEWSMITKNGDKKIVSISMSVIKKEQGIIHIMALISDISEPYKTRKIIEQQKQELEQLNATKDRFISIIAHDLKNPMGNILNFAELLHQKYNTISEEKKVKFVEVIHTSSQKVYNLLENLLQWSRSQMGKLNINKQVFNIQDLIEQTIGILEETAKNKEIEISTVSLTTKHVVADINSIKTILLNLISNAIKFSQRGGTIEIKKELTGENQMQISIKDEGAGIPEEKIQELFIVDKAISTKGTENETGTGLGLIICKEFIVKNGGEIWVESQEGKGSTFYFTLLTPQDHD